jgi:hypothetical protein
MFSWFKRRQREREIEEFVVLRNIRERMSDAADPWRESEQLLLWAKTLPSWRLRRLHRKWILFCRDDAVRRMRRDQTWRAVDVLRRAMPQPPTR